ncbi:MAG: hypothetical protein WC498_00805 [Candidatus Saccharimonadales bacterium]
MPKKPAARASKTKKVSQTSLPKSSTPRKFKIPKQHWYMPWRRRYLPVTKHKPLSKARRLFARSLRLQFKNWKLFGGIVLIYGLLNLVLVRGISGSSDLGSIKSLLDSVFSGSAGHVKSAFLSFAYLLSTSGSGNTQTSGVYQSLLVIIGSLAFIWALRQVIAKNSPRIRDSFYRGMYPLIPFLLVLLVIGLQLLPLAIGGSLYSSVISNGIAIHTYEKFIFGFIFFLLSWLSLYWITSSMFALYIVSLPDMTPIKALRSAKQLVRRRRLLIWRKLIFLPVIMLLIATAVEIPLILFLTVLAPWAFFVLSMVALAIVHGYLYSLYRELIDD